MCRFRASRKGAVTYFPTFAVSSAWQGLTSLFGMGRGGSLALWPPEFFIPLSPSGEALWLTGTRFFPRPTADSERNFRSASALSQPCRAARRDVLRRRLLVAVSSSGISPGKGSGY